MINGKVELADAILSLMPTAQVSIVGGVVTWVQPSESPFTEAALSLEIQRLQELYDAQEYARRRALAYPPIGDQLDALFKAGVFPPEMAAQIQAVKDKYPKGVAK